VDWVTIKGGGLLRETSGTSIRAMFRLIEQAAEAIRRDYGAGANIRTAIERALRAGEREVLANGEFIDLTPYLEAAADEVAPVALAAMKADMALQDNVADVLVLAGGGGHLYEKAAREIFQDCRYVVSFENAVTAISEGYWLIAQGIASQIQSNAA